MGFTSDVSAGGLFLVTWDTVPIGQHIHMKFTLPGSDQVVEIDGVVRWVRDYNPSVPDLWPGMGIQFESLSDEQKKRIENYIAAREPIFYD
jgi:uncharacterized protein (TIGR02266 family)